MIDKQTFSKEWILKVKGDERNDQGIIERQIYALHLLETLRNSFENFIFKGGTCLSLIAEEFPRFSVDIDILVKPQFKYLFDTENLSTMIKDSEFQRVTENVRQPRHDIDKQHFEFFYNGPINGDTYILLDVVYDESKYKDLIQVEINNYLIKTTHPYMSVIAPSVHDLLADKLCAFAPNTVGKKLNENRDIEVVKQMFDVSFLMKRYPFSPSYKTIYENITLVEIKRRDLEIEVIDVLADTIKTSLNIISEGSLDSKQYQLIKNAIKGFSSFTRDLSYNVDKAKESALDVLHAALLVLAGNEEDLLKIANEQTGFLNEYQLFKRARKQLAAIGPELPILFNICLRCMSHFNISLS
jgi:predicted nucleotidyltransferase component of viral defense system